MTQKAKVYEALKSGGLKEDQLGLIADDPEVAKEAAGAIQMALDRRRARAESIKNQGPSNSSPPFGTDPPYCW